MLWRVPWDPMWGPAGSAAREINYFLLAPPTIALSYAFLWWFAQHRRWLAPPGEYMPDRKYSVWDIRQLIFVALYGTTQTAVVALTGGSAIVDFAYMVDGIFATYFGVFVAWGGNTVGILLRRFLVYGSTGFAAVTLGTFADSFTTLIPSAAYWAFARGKGLSRLWRYVYVVVPMYVFVGLFYIWQMTVTTPTEMWGIYTIEIFARTMPLACLNWSIGALIGETALQRKLRGAAL